MNVDRIAIKVASELSPQSISSMVSMLALLEAAFMVNLTSHWQTNGSQYYGDHILLQRIYEDSEDFIDSLAERIMGLGGAIPAPQFTNVTAQFVSKLAPQSYDDPDQIMAASLTTEKVVVDALTNLRANLETTGELTDGLDNLLQGISDKHEEFLYLLQQRMSNQG
jgi:starvation-inducible DNA-binding protein